MDTTTLQNLLTLHIALKELGIPPYSAGFKSVIEGRTSLSSLRYTEEYERFLGDGAADDDYSDSVLYSFILVARELEILNKEIWDVHSLRYLAWKTLMLNHINLHRHPEEVYEAQ